MTWGKRRILAVGIVLALLVGTAIAGCNAPGTQPSSGTDSTSANTTTNASLQLAETYPLQYQSIQNTRVNAKGIVIGHTVENLREICEAPVERDMNGDPIYDEDGNAIPIEASYNPQTGTYDINLLSDEQLKDMNLRSGCVSCKTSRFNEIYAQQGVAAFGNAYNAEARAIVADDYFDCALCHVGDPESGDIEPTLMYFPALGTGLADHLDERNGVCAQCHNSYDYRSLIETEDDLQRFQAYRNGYDVDGLFETCWEDGVNFEVDEETGIAESYVLHPTIELFMGTKMQMLGVTCCDCHMPKIEAADGTMYTDHFSANSPLESEDSLQYCLNCHEQQGTESTDAMESFVRSRQAEMSKGMAALQKREAAFKQALEEAIAVRGKNDPSLDEAKKLYAKVTWYDMSLVTGPSESPGSQVAMLDWHSILKKANTACDEGMALLG